MGFGPSGPGAGGSASGAAGGVLSGTYPNPGFNGSTVPAGSALGITDALNTASTVVLNYKHLLSAGVAGVGFGVAQTYSFADAAGTIAVQGSQSFSWLIAAAGTATSRFDVALRSAGAAAVSAFALHGTDGGSLVLGPLASTHFPTSGIGLYLMYNAAIYFREGADINWIRLIGANTSDQVEVGQGGTSTIVRGGFEFPGAYITNSITQDVTGSSGSVTTPTTFRANAGAAAANTGIGNSYQVTNSTGVYVETGRVSFIWTVPTSTNETGAMTVSLRAAGVPTAEKYRFGGDGGLLFGTTTALGNAGIGLANATIVYGRNAANSAWRNLIQLNASDQVEVGGASVAVYLKGSSILLGSSAQQWGTGTIAVLTLGRGNGSTPLQYVVAGPVAAGTDVDAGTFIYRASLGTGTGATGRISFEGGITSGVSGLTQQTTIELIGLLYSNTNDDTMMFVTSHKGGVDVTDRVTLVAGASVAASGRKFLSVPA